MVGEHLAFTIFFQFGRNFRQIRQSGQLNRNFKKPRIGVIITGNLSFRLRVTMISCSLHELRCWLKHRMVPKVRHFRIGCPYLASAPPNSSTRYMARVSYHFRLSQFIQLQTGEKILPKLKCHPLNSGILNKMQRSQLNVSRISWS